MQAAHTLQTETSSFYEVDKFIYFLLKNRIRIDHEVSNQSYKYKAKATNFSTNWNKEILKSLLYNFRGLPFTSGQGVAWFKEGKKSLLLNKMVGAYGPYENKQSPNLHWAKESYICNANFVHIGVFVCMNLLVGGVRWSGAIGTLGIQVNHCGKYHNIP